ncbi:MAG: histidinol dehydrogenase [Promethearchaeia archaeon]
MNLIRKINSTELTENSLPNLIPRGETQLDEIKEDVLRIIDKVKKDGDSAIIDLSKKFDKVDLDKSDIQVTEEEINAAFEQVDKDLLEALRYAKKNLIKFHQAQLKEDWDIQIEEGVKVGQIYRPLDSVGLYIPGGRAIYPSTVLMAATPAFVAGVKEILICSPPQQDKSVAPEILVAAKLFEIDKIYKCGGAQAIAAMAYGTKSIPNVDKIIGPGNKWVNAAKQILSNRVAIDIPAGPSEILIIADQSANSEYVMKDFLSQIEHDPDNIGMIASTSNKLTEFIETHLETAVEQADRRDIIREALENSLLIEADSVSEVIRITNLIASEHLEILMENPREILKFINNAGAVFIGPFSPVPLGDYSAGTNHILPTGGTAKRYSGLNTNKFIKTIDVLECTEAGLMKLKDSATKIANFEKLFAHKKAIEERLNKVNK